jgi:Sulfotransferase family
LRIVVDDRRGVGNGFGEFQSVMLREPITKIAFLHIPKTAGISIIDAFRGRLGPDNCVAFSNVEISEESFRHKRFVSGHVYLGDIRTNAFTFTFLREPLKQIASHLMWIDHYNLPDYRHEASHFHSSIKTAIERLARTDFSDARSIDQCLEGLPSDSDWMINLQSTHLAFCRNNIFPLDHRELAAAAISNLSRIAFTGLAERLSADVAKLFQILDLGDAPTVLHLNQSPAARKIDLSEPNIRRVLSKYVEADMRLYDHVVSNPKH